MGVLLLDLMVRTKNNMQNDSSKSSPSKKSSPTKERKAKDFWIGCKVKLKDHTFTASPEQRRILGVDTLKRDIFGLIVGPGTKSKFHWMVEFADDVGLLEVEDKNYQNTHNTRKN